MASFISSTTFIGDNSSETFAGPQQNQYGIGGDDYLAPNVNNKSYFLYGGNGNDELLGFGFDDEIYGGRDNDDLYGFDGWDYLEGGSGSDELYGGYGNDVLSGGGGPDSFFFDTALSGKKNFDKILDFVSGSGGDLIVLSKAIFGRAGGVDDFLPASKFEEGSEATSSKTRILHNENKGALYYTPKGDDGSQTKFAKVTKGMDLDNGDFFIVA
jgi:Ca2+-binding RTX toxin-like protein